MNEPLVQWTTPAPLWGEAVALGQESGRTVFRQPTLLRFASDTFMDDFMALLENAPERLDQYRARPETWREPAEAPPPVESVPSFERPLRRRLVGATAAGPATGAALAEPVPAVTGPAAPVRPFKLYQPGHQRFYLVSACLVCRIPGMPDRTLDPGAQERVSFVVRRLRGDGLGADPRPNPASYDECALVTRGKETFWQPIASDPAARNALVAGEEQNGLFGVNFVPSDGPSDGGRRRLFAGLVPVGKRELYVGTRTGQSPADGSATASDGPDPREILLWSQVREPWKTQIDRAGTIASTLLTASTSERVKTLKETREGLQTVSWYILLDLADFLQQHVPAVWAVLTGVASTADADTQGVVDALRAVSLRTDLSDRLIASQSTPLFAGDQTSTPYDATNLWSSLADALVGIGAWRQKLEAVMTPYDRKHPDRARWTQTYDSADDLADWWPNMLFPLADPEQAEFRLQPVPSREVDRQATIRQRIGTLQAAVDDLAALVASVLPSTPTAPAPAVPLAAKLSQEAASQPRNPGPAWFVIRCVFERPRCGPWGKTVVSEPTMAFQMASYYDPDAPARPIRIPLPGDISPAGLRKFDKNTAFMLSDMLCGQVDRIKALSLGDLVLSVLPWPFHKDLPDVAGGPCRDDQGGAIGLICSLSIPIVTICALILLIIIVSILDYIFRWLPYFFICFPFPKFSGKEGR